MTNINYMILEGIKESEQETIKFLQNEAEENIRNILSLRRMREVLKR